MHKPTLTLTALVGIAVAATAYAHGGATGIVKERMDQMVVLREATKTLKAELAAGGAYNTEAVTTAAATIKAHAGDALTRLFPEGSLNSASEAKPEVWTDWERFAALAADLAAYADALALSAANGIPNTGGVNSMAMGSMTMSGHDSMAGGMTGGAMIVLKPDPAALATQPPMEAFMALSDTCAACHTDFRQKKGH